jgi:hypothetical protein
VHRKPPLASVVGQECRTVPKGATNRVVAKKRVRHFSPIKGNGHTISRSSGAADFRLFFIDHGANVVFFDTTISGNSAGGCDGGGGVTVMGTYNSSTASIINSTLSGNEAPLGGGIVATDDATATLTNATVSIRCRKRCRKRCTLLLCKVRGLNPWTIFARHVDELDAAISS